jgi:hypothetical protein
MALAARGAGKAVCSWWPAHRAPLGSALRGAGALQEEVNQCQHQQSQAEAQTALQTFGDPRLHV